jgi:hypothetical protein
MGCGKSGSGDIKPGTEYQAIFLDNGQVFFGTLENAGSDYPLLKDAFYVQSQTDPTTKQVRNILIKRGNELHGPDKMYLNARHIVVIESVGPNSKVAQLIKEAKTQKPAGTP